MSSQAISRVDPERCRKALRDILYRLMPRDGDYPQPFGDLTLYRRSSNDNEHVPIIYKPVIIVIAQGEKNVRLGADEFVYGDSSYFVTGVDMPTACAVQGVSPEHPFLSLSLDLDRSLIARMSASLPPRPGHAQPIARGAMLATLDAGLLDALLRLVELAEQPDLAPSLAPLIVQEIHYRLLCGEFGPQLRAINSSDTPSYQIARTILWLKENFREECSIGSLARLANMAPSTFHKHFKDVTAMSPLQFQKRLRLERAQQLMLTQNLDATRASLAVGYENPQQFGREYKRMFGNPPHRDILLMRRRQAGNA